MYQKATISPKRMQTFQIDKFCKKEKKKKTHSFIESVELREN